VQGTCTAIDGARPFLRPVPTLGPGRGPTACTYPPGRVLDPEIWTVHLIPRPHWPWAKSRWPRYPPRNAWRHPGESLRVKSLFAYLVVSGPLAAGGV